MFHARQPCLHDCTGFGFCLENSVSHSGHLRMLKSSKVGTGRIVVLLIRHGYVLSTALSQWKRRCSYHRLMLRTGISRCNTKSANAAWIYFSFLDCSARVLGLYGKYEQHTKHMNKQKAPDVRLPTAHTCMLFADSCGVQPENNRPKLH